MPLKLSSLLCLLVYLFCVVRNLGNFAIFVRKLEMLKCACVSYCAHVCVCICVCVSDYVFVKPDCHHLAM